MTHRAHSVRGGYASRCCCCCCSSRKNADARRRCTRA